MFPSIVFCAVLGWFIGVHAPFILILILGIVSGFGVLRGEGLGSIAIFLGVSAPFIVGMLLGSLIYGDLGGIITTLDFKYLFTGE
ncbi:MAG: hypothetical protein GY861_10870 [bacterium]|nr:hypothetical protein [bacterium]